MDTVTDPAPLPLTEDPDLRVHSAHAESLAREISALFNRLLDDRHTYLILEVRPSGRYVQAITFDGVALQVESVGSRFIHSGQPLDVRQSDDLLRLGWNPPELDVHDFGNCFRRWDAVGGADVAEIGQLLALTLIRVHGLECPDDLVVSAGETLDDD
jgi:hypothetical protein